MHNQPNRPRTRTLDNLVVTPRARSIGRVRFRRATAPTSPVANAPMLSIVEGSRRTVVIPLEDIADLVSLSTAPEAVTRDELARRVRERLISNGSDPAFADMVIRPGFFANEDGLETVARALGVLASDEVVVDSSGGAK